MIDYYEHLKQEMIPVMPDMNDSFIPFPELLTETELISFLRIPQISTSKDHHNVIEHLKRYRDLPRLHICNKVLYPTQAIREWIEKETISKN